MSEFKPKQLTRLAARGAFGGTLMGLANLVPGISGGTMLLAAGVYPRFIGAIAEVTTFKFRQASLVVLISVALAALLAILFMAGTVKDLVVHHRWIMYSLFIGLTLGGVPIVWAMIGRGTSAMWIGAVIGFAGMAALALAQTGGAQVAATDGIAFMLLAGIAGASAMILPGVSGGYLLLVLGVYVPILAAVDACRQALSDGALAALAEPVLTVIAPVGVGVVIGIVAVSNVLRWLLDRYKAATLGVLLGLLLGAVVGLWPFQQGVAPDPGDQLKGQVVVLDATAGLRFAQSGRKIAPADYPTAFFKPSVTQASSALAIAIAGFGLTWLIGKFSAED